MYVGRLSLHAAPRERPSGPKEPLGQTMRARRTLSPQEHVAGLHALLQAEAVGLRKRVMHDGWHLA